MKGEIPMAKNLYCIVGESGSGKTTIANELEEMFGLKQIQSYTTRPKRSNDETGHTFITPEQFKELKNICAYANYNGYDYCATAEQIENNCIYVVNPAGIEQLKNNYKGNKKIYTIYISCRLADRYNRMTARGNTYDEALKRVINDADEFNGYKNNCDFVVRNDNCDDFSNVIDMIAEFINEKENE